MKHSSRLFLIGSMLILMILAVVLPAVAQDSIIGTINIRGGINILSGPGKNYAVRAGVANGAKLEVVGRNADSSWIEVITPNRRRTAWVNASVIDLPVEASDLPQTADTGAWSAYVKASFLNVRTGAGADYEIIGTLAYGRGVNVIGRNADSSWALIEIPGEETGWASTRYLSINFAIKDAPIVEE